MALNSFRSLKLSPEFKCLYSWHYINQYYTFSLLTCTNHAWTASFVGFTTQFQTFLVLVIHLRQDCKLKAIPGCRHQDRIECKELHKFNLMLLQQRIFIRCHLHQTNLTSLCWAYFLNTVKEILKFPPLQEGKNKGAPELAFGAFQKAF